MKRILGSLSMALAGGLLALGIHSYFQPDATINAANGGTSPAVRYVNLPGPAGTTMAAPDFTGAAERTVNAVVHVTTETMVTQRDPFADFFWGYRAPVQQRPVQGAGSGVIISDDGYIVTNNHVIEGADKIQVHLNDKRMMEARIIGRDPSTDIALLKVDASGLPSMPFGNSDDVKVGEWVLAVGNPFNLTSTVTAGIVSAKARSINILQQDANRDIFPIESFIQTDAAVNPGNSGGALVNAAGELIGINTAIASQTGSYAGYSFAVPVNIAKKVTGDLLEFGSVQRAYIGVSIMDMDQSLAKEVGMDRIKGVYVRGLTDDGAAAASGIKEGDVILKVGNVDVNNVPALQEQVGKFRPGNNVAVTVWRDGGERTVDVKLRGKDGSTNITLAKASTTASSVLGAEVRGATAEELKALNIRNGVKVTAINGGRLRSSGIKEGFIITRIDQQPVTTPEDIARVLDNKRGGVLIEGIYPNGTKAYYGLGV
ncbi:MAG: Do family serine endopeptidase [Flavobacteriales bacterium]|nr:MAG: Do family serine endopeptidase [Flavobacteriales bacterium]